MQIQEDSNSLTAKQILLSAIRIGLRQIEGGE